MQVDWAEMPTRPRIAGRERRVYALICSLPFSGASTAHFSFDMTIESFLEGHVRALAWLGGVPRECVYDNLRSAVARRDGDVVTWNPRFVQLRGHYAFHATACTPATPREKGSVEGAVRYPKTGFWPARRFASLVELDDVYADWRDRIALPRRHATGRFVVAERLAVEREALRALPPIASTPPVGARRGCRWTATSSTPAASTARREALVHQRVELRFDRDRVWIEHRGAGRRALPAQLPRGELAAGAADAPRAAGARAGDPDRGPRGRPAGAGRLRRALRMSAKTKTAAASASGCPTCSPSSRRRACSSASSRRRRGPARSTGPTSSSSRRCSRPRCSRATPPAPASASATPPSRPTRRWRTSTSPPSPAPRSR